MNLTNKLSKRKEFLVSKITQKHLLEEQVESLIILLAELKDRGKSALKLRKIINLAATSTHKNLENYITTIVNLALKAVLDNPPVFSMNTVERRNQPECDLMLDGDSNTKESYAGGERDIVSFALQCVFIILKELRRVLIIDEAFKNLSHEYHSNCADMVKMLSKEIDCQIILATHIPKLKECADNVFYIRDKYKYPTKRKEVLTAYENPTKSKEIGELRVLYNDFPELWEELEEMDKKSFRKFRSDYSVAELREKFTNENL